MISASDLLLKYADLVEALEEIADHPIVSESKLADDNCDWHCTVTLAGIAKDALAEAKA